MQFAACNLQCEIVSVQCEVYSLQSAVQFTVPPVHYDVASVHSIMKLVQICNIESAGCSVQYELTSLEYVVHTRDISQVINTFYT